MKELFDQMTSITPSRSFNMLYIILDCVFLAFIVVLMILDKKYLTLLWSLLGGIIYLGVDFGIFYLATGTRTIYFWNGSEYELASCAKTFWTLLWLSFSYGIPNFCFIWLALKKDKHTIPYALLIFGWWIVLPILASLGAQNTIITQRTTNNAHFIMAIIFVVGWAGYILYSFFGKKKVYNILMLNVIGILTQFGWEFALLVAGIRPWNDLSLKTLFINSFLETNMGMPYFFFICAFIRKHINEDLTKRIPSPILEDKVEAN